MQGKLSWKQRLGYGSGDYALNLYWQGASFYLLFYFTDVLGLPNAVAGTIFAIGGFWDAISDPVMGYVAERAKNKKDLYRPYLLFGCIPLALSFVLLMSPISFDSVSVQTTFTLCALLVFRTCYTIVSIPYSALGARLTRDSKERTRISGVRMYCGFLGGISVIGIAAFLQQMFDDKTAFFLLSIACAILCVSTLLFCHRQTNIAGEFELVGEMATKLSDVFTALLKNIPFMVLFGALLLTTVAITLFHAIILYYFEYSLGDRSAGNTAIFMMTATPLAFIPVWSVVALKIGKRLSWIAGSLIAALGFISLWLDKSGNVYFAISEIVLTAIGLNAYAVLLWSMLPDTIDYGEYHTGVRNESLTIGLLSSGQKAAIAAVAYGTGIALNYIGYSAGEIQSAQTLEGLKYMVSLIPAAMVLISIPLVLFYPLSAAKLNELQTAKFNN